ncbi:FdhF/YdeP family oxidoreductase [Flavobacteriaceae bacterium]|nr:FdhF/YdeP family oxidoreductase [Flavobacteriaceae bacterium]
MDTIYVQPPVKFTGIKRKQVPTKAAGLGGVTHALEHVNKEMGIRRGFSALYKMNQFKGFDCPGCAWPDPDAKRAFLAEYCENGAKAIAEEATTNRVSPLFFATHSISQLSAWSDYELGKSGRITHPVIKRPGTDHYTEISWHDAFNHIAKELNDLIDPNRAIFYTSGRTSNEAAYLYQLFVRQFGTNNLPDCSNMCHESSGAGLGETLGIGKGSVTLEDFDKADLVIVMGQNPGTNHPRMLKALSSTKNNGGKIIAINPLKEVGLEAFSDPQNPLDLLGKSTSLADIYLQLIINSDVALLKAIMKELIKRDAIDHKFIAEKTHNIEALIEDLENQDFNKLLKQTGLASELVYQAIDLIAASKNIIICWAMGLTQQVNGVDNIREVVNLLLLKGSIGKPGAGTCPVRGHSNVQGDRTMGIWEKPKEPFSAALSKRYKFESPRAHGYDVVESILAMKNGQASVFFAMGGNFLSATPDTELTAKALQVCKLSVQVSTKLNRSHLITGETAIILPCLGRSDIDIQLGESQFISVEDSMGVVHASKGNLQPISKQLKSEVEIICRLALTTLKNSEVAWADLFNNYDLIRDEIQAVIPGFMDYNKRVREKGGFYLPNNARVADFSKLPYGKALFTVNKTSEIKKTEDEFIMMTIRTHDQFNTTIYGLDDRYRGVLSERRVVFINPKDLKKIKLKDGDIVDLSSHYDHIRTVEQFILVSYNIPQGCVATYFPEANPLVPINLKARISNTPASKGVLVKINKHAKS